MEKLKNTRHARWGTISSIGTEMGKPRNVGMKTASIGIERSKLDEWCWNNNIASLVFNMTAMDKMKRVDSKKMLTKLV